MELVLHAGAHFTEEDRLLRSLLRNAPLLTSQGVVIPDPGRYRQELRETLNALPAGVDLGEIRDQFLSSVATEAEMQRLVLSHGHFFGIPRAAVKKGSFYPLAVERVSRLSRLFHDDQVELFVAMRNPASFLPALLEKSPAPDMRSFLGRLDPRQHRWSELFSRLHVQVPHVSITVWCREDSPLIWGELLRRVLGLPLDASVVSEFDLLGELLSPEAMVRFQTFLKERPNLTEFKKRQVIGLFLEKFALSEAVEEEFDLPGWREDLIEELTELYDQDLFEIKQIPNITVVEP